MITENQLDNWVGGHSREAQGVIVELVYRLVAASCPRPTERRFPLGDSIEQPGPDGFLNTDYAQEPFVPEGMSYWEIGTGRHAGDKATSDYGERTDATPEDVRTRSTFIFVTPLSGRTDWPHTWKANAQARWVEDRRQRGDWRDVRAIDASRLIDWLYHFPAVEHWLAQVMGYPIRHIQTAEDRWDELHTIGAPPPLIPDVFLSSRDAVRDKLSEVFSATTVQLRLDTRSPEHVADFVAAHVAALESDSRIDALGRCLLISNPEAWSSVVALQDRHIFVADFDLDDADPAGTKLLERAFRAGHAVVFGGMPGGIPHPNRIALPSPKIQEVHEALRKAGYNDERARMLSQKSEGNLTFLLRCLQNLSLMPEWAQGTTAAEFAIAQLLGSWTESSDEDIRVVETIAKKAYGEWIGPVREALHRPGTPLTLRDGVWKVTGRYEAWFALGSKIFDDQLDRMRECSIAVLKERDPKFELPSEDRFAASIHGKVLSHSVALRRGFADTLALLGSHPEALTSCSFGKSEVTAVLIVREVLRDADWQLWASLNDLLPLIAEAAPAEFLSAVEDGLGATPSPFDGVFAQEGTGGLGGWNYMTGLLWAMETLAWDAEYLTRVVVALGELAARDPGGNWANRPSRSLSTIFLPWLPQTCAPLSKKRAAVTTLLREAPGVGWKLVLDLLPSAHQTSMGSRKPAWREIIPEDWKGGVTRREYWEETLVYSELAVAAAKDDATRLTELIERIDNLPDPHRATLVGYLSGRVVSASESERFLLWTALAKVVSKHRRFANAQWAMTPEVVDEIDGLAQRLAPRSPQYRFRRLFNDADIRLYEEVGNYEQQGKQLEERRILAVAEILSEIGFAGVLQFAESVSSPWRVGTILGLVGTEDLDVKVLPSLLEVESKPLAQFAGGYVVGRFRMGHWNWVDQLDTSAWPESEKGQLLAYLPFVPITWERVSRLLTSDDSAYWLRANANPYETDEDISYGIDKLVEHGRAHAAIECLTGLRHKGQPIDPQRVIRALRAVLATREDPHGRDDHAIVELIAFLQETLDEGADDLFQIEWAFLALLDEPYEARPSTLHWKLSGEPGFFCELIRLVFLSRNSPRPASEPTREDRQVAQNAYRLLSHWRIPPGSQRDGTFDGTKLNSWIDIVKAECLASGHSEVAATMVGQVLVYAPPDPNGLWLHTSVATVLNARDADEMRAGFRTELFNSRGVHWVDPEGTEEVQLAGGYEAKGEQLEAQGYHRLAVTMKELAASYRRDSEWQRTHQRFED